MQFQDKIIHKQKKSYIRQIFFMFHFIFLPKTS